jgi:hypothetical protein
MRSEGWGIEGLIGPSFLRELNYEIRSVEALAKLTLGVEGPRNAQAFLRPLEQREKSRPAAAGGDHRGKGVCMRLVVSSLVLLAFGCFSEEADSITVTLSQDGEEVRTLPVLASGAVSLLDVDVPDSHGSIDFGVHITGATEVELTSLGFAIEVDGAPLDVRITRQHVGDTNVATGPIPSTLHDGDVLTIDFRARQLDDIMLPEGVGYTAALDLGWREVTLETIRQADTASLEVVDTVAATVDAGSFALLSDPAAEVFAPAATGAEFSAAAEITSGLTVDIQAVRARTVYFGTDDTVPGIGLAIHDAVAHQVGGSNAVTVAPGATLDLYSSSDPDGSPAPSGVAGVSASVGDASGGKAVLTIEIDYEPTDGTPGVQTDVLVVATDTQ